MASLDGDKVHNEHCNTPLPKYVLMIDLILAMVSMGNDVAAVVEGDAMEVEDAAMMQVGTCKGEDMVEVVMIF